MKHMSLRPSAFTFTVTPAFNPATIVDLAGGNLVVSNTLGGELVAESRFQVTPSKEHWEAFWKAVDFLDVWHWRPQYDTRELGVGVRDGKGWKLQMQQLDHYVATGGANAYPSFSSIDRPSLDEERFGLFLFALGELLSHKMGA
jgi:hypothetical protein